ncbi:MAG: DUF1311 domain-containing protein [Acidobacteria bacterium]|nr:MAG: DUF1311 domain-containing protein [Acidobacteriota bacterium]REJ98661.1 MAG: DUF1311 domain-containing protein [Acidobacteriota bacterium]REK16683.1 MAG: DUF1311 domain-containing protein [Acidobacteriota bacterium]REK42594.1 MAG: DUF1311 domain-containing protein [Acidobacteriota bacterium]
MNRKRGIISLGGIILALLMVGNLAAISSDNATIGASAGFEGAEVRQDNEADFLNAKIKECTGSDESEAKREKCVDEALDTCIDTYQSTAGQVACIRTATDIWEKKMNAAFNELTAKMDGEQGKALSVAQESWKRSIEADLDLLYAIQGTGTMYVPMRAYQKYEWVKGRANTLQAFQQIYHETNG